MMNISDYKKEFIDFMLECNVLRFGDFVTKSGRNTPFFINTGNYCTGRHLQKLGEYYSIAIKENLGLDFDVLFGPAYKGIPLSAVTAVSLYERYGKEVAYCSNRKEVKDHGDKGILLGSPLKDGDRVVIIEDVTTAGTSIRESVPIIKAQGDIDITGLVVSVDRMEKGTGDVSALKEIEDEFGIKTASIVNMAEITDLLCRPGKDGNAVINDELKKAIDAYYEKYGCI